MVIGWAGCGALQQRDLVALAQAGDELGQFDIQLAEILNPEVGHESVALGLIHAGHCPQLAQPFFFRASAERAIAV